MSGRSLIKEFDSRRLRLFLALFFLALSIPTGLLIWQAYSQLKWEAFHQYRGMAAELTARIDNRLLQLTRTEEERSFADYAFLVVTGDASANFLQRSALSEYPIAGEFPGLLGYFQVAAQGKFSTPILPDGSLAEASYGIPENEYAERRTLALQISAILSENRLLKSRPDEIVSSMELDSQLAFDELNEESLGTYPGVLSDQKSRADLPEALESSAVDNKPVRVAELKLDGAYQKKSADLEQQQQRGSYNSAPSDYSARLKRKEKISLPEPTKLVAEKANESLLAQSDLRINTFESEIDPFEFSLLDSGHFVLFRKVWREGERYVQGMLVDQSSLILDSLDRPFGETALSTMSDLIIAYRGDVLHTSTGDSYGRYTSTKSELDGALLYRKRLSAPLDGIELIYTVKQLPPGPGAPVLAWISGVLGLVFCIGFYGLYRMGLSQISLSRQQQDFVSAVSHELKTPLTSIRMYGEMLREGWASEDKKQVYYEYIHDESERLSRLISNVLQLANITRNDPQLEMKPVAVAEILAAVESKIAVQVVRASFELVLDCDSDAGEAVVCVDQDCFAQIIINLVDNAIKFSRGAEKKRVELSAKILGENKIVFALRDYGPGIPKDQIRKIFEMFYRAESELTRETVGTGIGLAIVHKLTLAMNSEVDVLNRDPGTEFRITVPIVTFLDHRAG